MRPEQQPRGSRLIRSRSGTNRHHPKMPLAARARSLISGRRAGLALTVLVALVALAAGSRLLRLPVHEAFRALSGARPLWLWAAGACFAAGLLCSGGAWRAALGSCGAAIGRMDAAARYSVGSLANSFLPGHVGEAARIALFSRPIPSRGRLWIAGGSAAAIGVARVTVLAALVLAAGISDGLPL